MQKLLTILFTALSLSNAKAQKQNNIWLFGNNAGLDFNSGKPVPILNSNFGAVEGCASIADKNTGKLLFSANGDRIFDANGNAMPGGYPLGGGESATQAAVIVPKPGSCTIYYLFALDQEAGNSNNHSNGGVNVNIVDMSANGGLGAVTSRDVPLLAPTTEKCATALASNRTDVWVVFHQWNSDAFYAYRVTSSGISSPVISHSGVKHYDSNNDGANGESHGYMRISNDGKKLALACMYALNLVQLFDFDNSTGIISNPAIDTVFPTGVSGPYGVCFSPGNSKLYVSYLGLAGDTVYQYNMLEPSNDSIIASRKVVASCNATFVAAIQQAPDGKLYAVRAVSDSLDVINDPDSLGARCNYVADGLYLGGPTHQGLLGLPDFIDYNLAQGIIGSRTANVCYGQSVLLTATGGTSYSWSPDTALSATTGDSVIATPTKTTTYTVTGTTSGNCTFTDSIVVTVVQPGNLNITATPDSVCSGNNSTLSVSSASGSLQWQSEDTTGNFVNISSADSAIYQTPLLSQTTGYRLIVSVGSCTDTSSPVPVVVRPAPVSPTLSANRPIICASDSALIQATPGYASYRWNDNDTTSYTYANSAGNYWVTVTNVNGCTAVSSHQSIGVYPVPSVSIIQQGDTLSSFGQSSYQWIRNETPVDSATGSFYVARQPGSYAVEVTDTNGCTTVSNPVIISGISVLTASRICNIYPDPFTNTIFIDDNNGMADNIAIYNAIGEKVLSKNNSGLSLHWSFDVSILPRGIYIVQVTSGASTFLKKMIKE